MIPRLLHYVWVGSDLPQTQKSFIASWQKANPEYTLIKWDESNIDFSVPQIQQAYKRRQWAKVADIVRLIAVRREGGIYLDTDFMVLKPLDVLLHHHCFFGFQHEFHESDWIANGAFGAEPNHWFINKALDRLLSLPSRQPWLERPTAFGPKLITQLLREEGLITYSPSGVLVKDVYLCPVPVFYPFSMCETFTEECVRPETVAAHYWCNSWKKSLPLPIRMARAVRNRARSLF